MPNSSASVPRIPFFGRLGFATGRQIVIYNRCRGYGESLRHKYDRIASRRARRRYLRKYWLDTVIRNVAVVVVSLGVGYAVGALHALHMLDDMYVCEVRK